MKVALDATPLTVATGGVRRYTEELFAALQQRYAGEHEFLLLSDQLERPAAWLERRWWAYGLRRALQRRGVHVFHGTDFSVPYWPGCASVMTVHDLSPWKDPRWHPGANRVRRRTPWQLRLGAATMVITPSEAIRREAMARFSLAPATICAVPLAAGPHFRPVAPAAWPRPYFLCVGTLEPRKNIQFLVECWRAAGVDADLVLAGRVRSDFPGLPDLPGLHQLGAVPEEELPALYSGALAALYPSLYEGFGLPVLEAMQCGAPVVTSNDPALRETGGDAALSFDAQDVNGWRGALGLLAADAALRAERQQRSLQQAAKFSWRNTAEQTFGVYEEAHRRFVH